jgi:hypothetical protein
MYLVFLTINIHYFTKNYKQINLFNGDAACYLCGMNGIFKCYADEIMLQRVKKVLICRSILKYGSSDDD